MGSIGGGGDKATLARLESIDTCLKRLPDVMFRAMRDAKVCRDP